MPGANAAGVCEALQQWHGAEGYERVTSRLLFDCRYTEEEVRAFVISNERWCVVLYSDAENTSKLRRALSRFPVMVQLWADDGRWGYHLDEHGKQVARFCTLRRRTSLGEGDLAHVASACGVPEALPQLKRIQSGRFLFNEKPCSEFADALNVPVAALSFHDVDIANAGITEERSIAGWKCQMLCFARTHGKSNDHHRQGAPEMIAALTNSDRTEIARFQKKAKWLSYLIAPFAAVASLLVIPLIAVLGMVGILNTIPCVRKACLGKAVTFRDLFVKRLKNLEPERILIQDESVTNTRHGCSITVVPPAKPLADFLPRKGGRSDEQVFDVEIGKDSISCTAFPNREPKWNGVEVLEKRAFFIRDIEVNFEKHRTTGTKNKWFHYQWTLRTPQAVYQFFNSREVEWAAAELELLETMVRSFKLGRTG